MPEPIQPQKSEVHEATDDAASSPAAAERPRTGSMPPAGVRGPVRPVNVDLSHVKVVRDDTDVGGPLAIETDEPGLVHPEIHADTFADPKFPTDATPEFEPPEERRPPEARQ